MTKDKTARTVTKKNLKTMRKSSGRHRVRTATRIVKYGSISFARNVWLTIASVLVMTITLLILFFTVLASVVLSDTANTMREKIDITIYLKPGTSEESLAKLSEIIKEDPNVKSVDTATSDAEYELSLSEIGDSAEISEVFNDESMQEELLAAMQSTMRIKVYDVEKLDGIRNIVSTNPLFAKYLDEEREPTYDTSQEQIAHIISWANIAKNGGIILSAIFLVISILIIFNTIRMAIFSRREEIYMMKLVGADKNFIRGPFLVEAEISGIISGLIAATISYFGFTFLAPRLASRGIDVSTISSVLDSNLLVIIYLAFILVGIIVGAISARFAVSKYLRKD